MTRVEENILNISQVNRDYRDKLFTQEEIRNETRTLDMFHRLMSEVGLAKNLRFSHSANQTAVLYFGNKQLLNIRVEIYLCSGIIKVDEWIDKENDWLWKTNFMDIPKTINQLGKVGIIVLGNGWNANGVPMEVDEDGVPIWGKLNGNKVWERDNSLSQLRPGLWIVRGKFKDCDDLQRLSQGYRLNKKWFSIRSDLQGSKGFQSFGELIGLFNEINRWNELIGKPLLESLRDNEMKWDKRNMELKMLGLL